VFIPRNSPHTFAPLSTIALGLILAFGSANASAQTLGAMNEENSEELWDSIDAEELDVEDDEVWETVEAGLSEELEAPTFDHCEGLLTHLDPIAVAPVSKPPRMSLYLEPGFNSRNRRITDSAQGQVSPNSICSMAAPTRFWAVWTFRLSQMTRCIGVK